MSEPYPKIHISFLVLSGTKLLLDFKSVSSSKSLLPYPCFLTSDLSLSALIFFLFSIILSSDFIIQILNQTIIELVIIFFQSNNCLGKRYFNFCFI